MVRRSRLSPGAVRAGARSVRFFATGGALLALFPAAGAARLTRLAAAFRAGAFRRALAVARRADAGRLAVLRAVEVFFLPADAALRAVFLRAARLALAFRRTGAFFRAVFRVAAFRLAPLAICVSFSFLRPDSATGLP